MPHDPVIARIDALKLQQIIHNLVRNSIEAVSAGGHVSVTVRADESHVHIRVEDDGPGIPDAIRSRIYEPFFTTKDSSTGLGMSIVHSMVTLHGGTIDIDSRLAWHAVRGRNAAATLIDRALIAASRDEPQCSREAGARLRARHGARIALS